MTTTTASAAPADDPPHAHSNVVIKPQKTCTIRMPTSSANSTCKLDRPSENRLAAVR